MTEEQIERMTKAIAVWGKRKNIRPVDFMRNMDWSHNYSWMILRGKFPFKEASWGRFICAYGMTALNELFEIADIDPENINASA